MANDAANVRLLYAILDQKCLKDIDWNKVASNPILEHKISNGHAARMRYSRFKKQIEGIPDTPRKPREPKSPRKSKIEKKPAGAVKKGRKHEAEKIKEEAGVAGSSHHTPVTGTPEPGLELHPGGYPSNLDDASPFVKREASSSNDSRYPSTPLESPLTPGSSFEGRAGMSEMGDLMLSSFTMPGHEHELYGEPMMGMPHQGFEIGGLQMGHAEVDPYPGFWSQQVAGSEGQSVVKREPMWEPTYHQA